MSTLISCADSISRLVSLSYFFRHVRDLALTSFSDDPDFQVFLISLDAFSDRFEAEVEILEDSLDVLHCAIVTMKHKTDGKVVPQL